MFFFKTNNIHLLLLAALFSYLTSATTLLFSSETKKTSGSNDLPIELNLVFGVLNKNGESAQSFAENYANSFKTSFGKMSKEEIFFYVKTETYKTILNSANTLDLKDHIDPKQLLPSLQGRLSEIKASSQYTSMFIRWVAEALISDLETLNKNPVPQNASRILSLITPLATAVATYPISMLPDLELSLAKEICINLKQSLDAYLTFSRLANSPVPGDTVNIDELFKPLKANIESSKGQNDNVFERLLQEDVELQKKTAPDPKYLPPESLPLPVDNWDIPALLSPKLPTKDPNYQPPAKLPEPVGKWEL